MNHGYHANDGDDDNDDYDDDNVVDHPTQLICIWILICQQTNTKSANDNVYDDTHDDDNDDDNVDRQGPCPVWKVQNPFLHDLRFSQVHLLLLLTHHQVLTHHHHYLFFSTMCTRKRNPKIPSIAT